MASPHFVGPGFNILDNVPAAAISPPGTPVMRWDFTDISTLWQNSGRTTPVTTDGDDILGVTDLGTAGNHLTPVTVNGPRYTVAGTNGLSHASFDVANQEGLVTAGTFDLGVDYAWLTIADYQGASLGYVARLAVDANSIGALQIPGPTVRATTLAGFANQDVAGLGVTASYGHVQSGTGEVSVNRAAGAVTDSTAVGALAASVISVGSRDSTSSPLDGFVSEVIVWDTTLPTQADIRQYATDKYGIVWA